MKVDVRETGAIIASDKGVEWACVKKRKVVSFYLPYSERMSLFAQDMVVERI